MNKLARVKPTEQLSSQPGSLPAPRLSITLMAALFIVALAGRFQMERDFPIIGTVTDLRLPGCLLLAIAAFFWRISRFRQEDSIAWPRFLSIFTLLIGFQLLSALWSPADARVAQAAWNLAALWIIVVATAAFATGDPERAARVLLTLAFATGIVWSIAALAAGPQTQGRYAAFGGGPNVFVRVVCLAIIASVTLAAVKRRWTLFLPLPFLAAMAILSGSRGGVVAFITAAIAFMLFLAPRRRLSLAMGTIIVGSLVAWASWTLLGDDMATLIDGRYTVSAVQQGNFSTRPLLFSYAWSTFLERPLSGAGLDSYFVNFGVDYPHNYMLAIAAESGIAAVALAALTFIYWWRDGRPWSHAPKAQIGCAVAAIYIALASNFSGDHYDTRFMWIFAVVATLRPRQSNAAIGRQERRPHGTYPRFGIQT